MASPCLDKWVRALAYEIDSPSMLGRECCQVTNLQKQCDLGEKSHIQQPKKLLLLILPVVCTKAARLAMHSYERSALHWER